MQIKIDHIPLSTNSPFLWEVELLSDMDHLSHEYLVSGYDSKRSMAAYNNRSHNIRDQVVSCLEHNFKSFDTLYQFSHWGSFETVADWYDHNIIEQTTFNKDSPGFNMGIHIDNRVVFGVIILNLEQNGCGTNFPEAGVTMSGDKNKGIFFLNHVLNRHEIIHNGSQDRYTLATLLYLRQLVKK